MSTDVIKSEKLAEPSFHEKSSKSAVFLIGKIFLRILSFYHRDQKEIHQKPVSFEFNPKIMDKKISFLTHFQQIL